MNDISLIIKYIELAVLVIAALICDIKTYKVKNVITLSFILAGILTNLYFEGVEGLMWSFAASVLPVVILIVMYILKMLGAGDIKLFSAIGAIMGIKFLLYSMALSFISGGVLAVIFILVRKNGRQRFGYLISYLKNCFLTLSLQPYSDFNNKGDGGKFQFAYAVFCGTLISVFLI